MFLQLAYLSSRSWFNSAGSCFSPTISRRAIGAGVRAHQITINSTVIPESSKMKANSLYDLYLEELKDLYEAKHQLIKA